MLKRLRYVLLGAGLVVAGVVFATAFTLVTVNDGSQSAPSFSFNSDTDTGFYRSGSGTVHFSGNNTDVMTLAPTGVTIPALTVSSCSGCGSLSQTVSSFSLQWVTGCSDDPTGTWAYVQTGSTVTMMPSQTVTCTSDGTAMQTAAGALPVALRPARVTQLKYLDLTISAVDTDTCITLQTDGQVQLHTGAACGTNPGNTSKVLTVGNQSPLTYLLN